MRIEIDCLHAPNRRDFKVAAVTFEATSSQFDKEVLATALRQAVDIQKRLNPHAANSSNITRDSKDILAHALMGVLSEYAWKYFINLLSVDTLVLETESNTSKNQIDLRLPRSGKTIEIRSSCVSNGIKFAVFGGRFAFDIIGPYHNGYKPGELLKDYFLRALFHFNNKDIRYFIESVIDSNRVLPFSIYLVGGATADMMQDKNLYATKELSENEITGLAQAEGEKSVYRVIPIPDALDSLQIGQKIISSEDGAVNSIRHFYSHKGGAAISLNASKVNPASVKMPHGKYVGNSLEKIFREDPDYLRRAVAWATIGEDPELLFAMRAIVELNKGGG